VNEKPRFWNDPLPRPQLERMDLPEDQHMDYWKLVIREFDWSTSRIQSKLLYTNKAKQPEGDVPS